MDAWKTHVRSLINRYSVGEFSDEYRVSVVNCYKCGTATPVFRWSEYTWDEESPPTPRPRTVSRMSSRTAGSSYWGNHCGRCDSLQGDFHLFTAAVEYSESWFTESGVEGNLIHQRFGEDGPFTTL